MSGKVAKSYHKSKIIIYQNPIKKLVVFPVAECMFYYVALRRYSKTNRRLQSALKSTTLGTECFVLPSSLVSTTHIKAIEFKIRRGGTIAIDYLLWSAKN